MDATADVRERCAQFMRYQSDKFRLQSIQFLEFVVQSGQVGDHQLELACADLDLLLQFGAEALQIAPGGCDLFKRAPQVQFPAPHEGQVMGGAGEHRLAPPLVRYGPEREKRRKRRTGRAAADQIDFAGPAKLKSLTKDVVGRSLGGKHVYEP